MAGQRRSDDYDDEERPKSSRKRSKRKRRGSKNLVPYLIVGGSVLLVAVLVVAGVLVFRSGASTASPTTKSSPAGSNASSSAPSASSTASAGVGAPTPPSQPAASATSTSTPANTAAPFPKEPTLAKDVADFARPWPDFDNVPADTAVLHIYGVESFHQFDVIKLRRLERIAPTTQPNGFFIAGERRGSKFAPPLLTMTVGPVHDFEVFARKINFGRVVALKGNVISISLRPEGPSVFTALAIRMCESTDVRTKIAGVNFLTEDLPENRQPEVKKALERILDNEPDNTPANEVNFRSLVMQPYCQAATREDVPALLRYLAREKGAGENPNWIMEALARLKDERGVKPIAERLLEPATRGDAKNALAAYGSMAEEEVLKLLKHEVADVRFAACEVLARIGTGKSLPELAMLSKDPVPQIRKVALDTLARVKKKVARDEEITKLLVGKWAIEEGTQIYNKDGTFEAVVTLEGGKGIEITVSGTWKVKEGVLIETITKSSSPIFKEGRESKDTVISIDEKVLKFKDEMGKERTAKRINE